MSDATRSTGIAPSIQIQCTVRTCSAQATSDVAFSFDGYWYSIVSRGSLVGFALRLHDDNPQHAIHSAEYQRRAECILHASATSKPSCVHRERRTWALPLQQSGLRNTISTPRI